MGLMFVLLFWFGVLVVAGTISSVALWAVCRMFTRNVQHKRRIRTFALLLPWMVLAVECVGFAGYAAINVTVRHRDLGIGDSFTAPLVNDYSLEAIDVTTTGWIVNRKTQPPDVMRSQSDAVADVSAFQQDGNIVSGTAKDDGVDEAARGEHYFLLDTQTAREEKFASETEWRAELARRGLKPHLQPFEQAFSWYRFNWTDAVFYGIGACIPLVGLGALLWLVVRARRAGSVPTTESYG